jgi:hypothetical protein
MGKRYFDEFTATDLKYVTTIDYDKETVSPPPSAQFLMGLSKLRA